MKNPTVQECRNLYQHLSLINRELIMVNSELASDSVLTWEQFIEFEFRCLVRSQRIMDETSLMLCLQEYRQMLHRHVSKYIHFYTGDSDVATYIDAHDSETATGPEKPFIFNLVDGVWAHLDHSDFIHVKSGDTVRHLGSKLPIVSVAVDINSLMARSIAQLKAKREKDAQRAATEQPSPAGAEGGAD